MSVRSVRACRADLFAPLLLVLAMVACAVGQRRGLGHVDKEGIDGALLATPRGLARQGDHEGAIALARAQQQDARLTHAVAAAGGTAAQKRRTLRDWRAATRQTIRLAQRDRRGGEIVEAILGAPRPARHRARLDRWLDEAPLSLDTAQQLIRSPRAHQRAAGLGVLDWSATPTWREIYDDVPRRHRNLSLRRQRFDTALAEGEPIDSLRHHAREVLEVDAWDLHARALLLVDREVSAGRVPVDPELWRDVAYSVSEPAIIARLQLRIARRDNHSLRLALATALLAVDMGADAMPLLRFASDDRDTVLLRDALHALVSAMLGQPDVFVAWRRKHKGSAQTDGVIATLDDPSSVADLRTLGRDARRRLVASNHSVVSPQWFRRSVLDRRVRGRALRRARRRVAAADPTDGRLLDVCRAERADPELCLHANHLDPMVPSREREQLRPLLAKSDGFDRQWVTAASDPSTPAKHHVPRWRRFADLDIYGLARQDPEAASAALAARAADLDAATLTLLTVTIEDARAGHRLEDGLSSELPVPEGCGAADFSDAPTSPSLARIARALESPPATGAADLLAMAASRRDRVGGYLAACAAQRAWTHGGGPTFARALDQLARLQPRSADLARLRGESALRDRRWREAARLFRDAVRRDHESPGAFHGLLVALEHDPRVSGEELAGLIAAAPGAWQAEHDSLVRVAPRVAKLGRQAVVHARRWLDGQIDEMPAWTDDGGELTELAIAALAQRITSAAADGNASTVGREMDRALSLLEFSDNRGQWTWAEIGWKFARGSREPIPLPPIKPGQSPASDDDIERLLLAARHAGHVNDDEALLLWRWWWSGEDPGGLNLGVLTSGSAAQLHAVACLAAALEDRVRFAEQDAEHHALVLAACRRAAEVRPTPRVLAAQLAAARGAGDPSAAKIADAGAAAGFGIGFEPGRGQPADGGVGDWLAQYATHLSQIGRLEPAAAAWTAAQATSGVFEPLSIDGLPHRGLALRHNDFRSTETTSRSLARQSLLALIEGRQDIADNYLAAARAKAADLQPSQRLFLGSRIAVTDWRPATSPVRRSSPAKSPTRPARSGAMTKRPRLRLRRPILGARSRLRRRRESASTAANSRPLARFSSRCRRPSSRSPWWPPPTPRRWPAKVTWCTRAGSSTQAPRGALPT